jgi:hypothetical protein
MKARTRFQQDTALKYHDLPSPAVLAVPSDSSVPHELAVIVPGQMITPSPLPAGWAANGLRGDLVYGGKRSMRSFHLLWLWLVFSLLTCVPASLYAVSASAPAGILLLALPAMLWLKLLVESWSWRYQIYQNRIDFVRGLLRKRKYSVWIWQIVDVAYERSCIGWLTNTATVRVLADRRACGQGIEPVPFDVIGLRNARFAEGLWEELQDAALLGRRTIKPWGI